MPADMTVGNDEIVYNWDNKLRSASRYVDANRTDSIHVKYDPMGNRVWKSSTVDGVETCRKYIVDIAGKLPTILCVLDAADPNLMTSSYYYADAQVLAQRKYPDPNVISNYDQQFYVHDRLGSVRLVVDYNDIDATVFVANSYTYTPFGSHYDGEAPAETTENPWQFTGQYFDAEINQYYLRARMYDPAMMRFTSRDPVRGEQNEPLSLHKYLYCVNDPANNADPSGELAMANQIAGSILAGAAVYAEGINTAAYGADTGNWKFFELSFDILEYGVPGAMALGAAGFIPKTAVNLCFGAFWTSTVGRVVDYHMNPVSSTVMPWQSTIWFYTVVTWSVNKHGISDAEIDDFNSWMYPEWVNDAFH